MLTASYQQNNDYNLANVRPFELDYNSVLQEAATRQQYWLEGVSKVQDAWKGINDLDPLNPINKQNLSNYREQAKSQIDKLSKEDLSQGDVVSKIETIFKPLYDSTNPLSRSLLVDSELNKHYKSQFNTIEKYKIKNNGEEYNVDNEMYLRDKYQEYAQKASQLTPDNSDEFEELYNKRGSYIPYYNYQKDIQEGLKNCKDNSTSAQTPQNGTGYMYQESVTGRNSEETARCIGASLSPKALNQMNIEAYVRYGKDYTALQSDLRNNIHQDKTSNLANIGRLQADLLNKNISQDEIDQINKQIVNLTRSNDDLKSMDNDFSDISHIEKNYEKLANYSYFNKTLSTLGNAFQHQEVSRKYSPDQAQLLKQKMAFEAQESNKRYQFDALMQNSDHVFTAEQNALNREKDLLVAGIKSNKGSNSTNTLGVDLTNPSQVQMVDTEEKIPERTKDDFLREGQSLLDNNKQLRTQILDLTNQLTSAGVTLPNMQQLPTETLEQWQNKLIDGVDRDKIKDPSLKSLFEKYDANQLLINAHNTEDSFIQKEVNKIKNKTINFTTQDGLKISGKISDLNIKRELLSSPGNPSIHVFKYIDSKGKEHYINDSKDQLKKEYYNNYLEIDNVYKKRLLPNHKGFDISAANSDNDNPVRRNLEANLAGFNIGTEDSPKYLDYKDIKLDISDGRGKIVVTLPGMTEKQIKTIYPNAKEYQKGSGKFVIEDNKWAITNDPHAINSILASNLENYKEDYAKEPLKYSGLSEIHLLSNYKGKWDVYTTPSSLGSDYIFVRNTKTGVVRSRNISEATDLLLHSEKYKQ